jgi:hypothetical protein
MQIMIIDYKLVYPSGTATGILINSFHTPGGLEIAKCDFQHTLLINENFFLFIISLCLWLLILLKLVAAIFFIEA